MDRVILLIAALLSLMAVVVWTVIGNGARFDGSLGSWLFGCAIAIAGAIGMGIGAWGLWKDRA